ncbi:shingomyelin synthase [Nematocida sp. AWRm77]|nr:shingomyelin synthase [Nematocida sp. AWRm77]
MNRGMFRNSADWVVNRYNLTVGKFSTLILMILLLLATIFCVNVAANLSSFWAPVKAYNPPLQDLLADFFNVTSYTNGWNNTVDALMISFCAVTAFLIVINRLAIFIALKLIFCVMFTYLLRCTTLMVTHVPDSWNMGVRTITDFYGKVERDRGGDLIFSGHTLLVCLFAHTWSSFYLVTDNYFLHCVLGFAAWVYVTMVMIFIIVGRLHYTIDVLLALYICSGVWWSTSYFCTRFFEDPVCTLKFRDSSLPPMNSTTLEGPPAQASAQTPAQTPVPTPA